MNKDIKVKTSETEEDFMEMADKFLSSPNLKIEKASNGTTVVRFSSEQIERIKLLDALKSKKNYCTPASWIHLFADYFQVEYCYKTSSIIKEQEPLSMTTFKAFTRTKIREMGLSKYLNKQTVDDIIELWVSEKEKMFLSKTRSSMKYIPQEKDLVRQWVKAATGKENKLDVAIMGHFVWQVRRKLQGIPVSNHIMPILFGKTGGGKSQAVIKMLKPLSSFVLHSDLSIFSDQFKVKQFSKMFVVFFDEMAKSDRVDVDKLKSMITADKVDFRTMHSEILQSVPQNSTFIGCSNDPVVDKIYDPTSARRYWQLNCADKLDWDVINSIDYEALWISIDESKESPIVPFLDEIHNEQNRVIRTKDLVEDWLSTECLPIAYDANKNPSSTQLYHHFKEWCRVQNILSQPSAQKFYRRLESVAANLKWQIASHRTNRGTIWNLGFKANESLLIDSNVRTNITAVNYEMELEELKSKVKEMENKIARS